MEIYTLINNFENYAISNYGNIKNVKKNKILKPVKNKNGYLEHTFCQNGVKKTFRIHRLVGLYFIPNPDNKPYINHKNGIKTDNCFNNLEWCTAKENDTHARLTGLKDQNKPIIAEEIETGNKIVFSSVSEAGAILGINKGTISKVLHNKRNKVNGYKFYFI
nr:MAG TPA: homing endonuclease [Caudoviricetes sp.]